MYFDPRYFFQPGPADAIGDFPFETGSLVEIEGVMVYHGKPDWSGPGKLSQVQWTATIFPNGQPVADEVLAVAVRAGTGGEAHTSHWRIDNDTRLLVQSDQPPPAELFVTPQAGDTALVCVTLQVATLDTTPPVIRLVPPGKPVDGLVLSEVRPCGP